MRPSWLLGIAATTCLMPTAALACGGLFCNTGLQQPVDQSAEQIIFVKEGDHGVAHIQISYTGSLPDFGWIVPVRTVPDVAPGSMTLFNELQQATAPRFFAASSFNGSSGCAPLCASNLTFKSVPGARAEDAGSSVNVLKTGSFGPFNYVVLESETADDLYEWLGNNNYNVPEGAEAIVQKYLDEKSKFLALKLQPDAKAQDLLPIKVTFPDWDPCIPLRLTAIAAQPDMGVLVYVLGETRAEPVGFGSVVVDDNLIKFRSDGTAPTNYRTVLTTAIKNAGAHAFTTEFAGPTSSLMNSAPVTFSSETVALLQSAPYLTRLYTVLSPDDMTIDPTFRLSDPGKLGDVSNIHQLPSTANSSMAPVEIILLAALAGSGLRRRRSGR